VSGDLGYVVAIEHSGASRRGAAPTQYARRVTTIFRREDGAWKIVHRHGDRYDESSRDVPVPLAEEADAAADEASSAQR
jgi:ketosteroid isomerase-like protein